MMKIKAEVTMEAGINLDGSLTPLHFFEIDDLRETLNCPNDATISYAHDGKDLLVTVVWHV